MILGVIYATMTTVWYLVLTSFAGSFSTKIKENEKIGVRLNKVSGVIFVLMGLQIAFM
uniref:hypothetical protein n=1 Tax=uncultured Tenacibaculum sp. TaxID=174713 RepID=UPI002611B0E2|nr:hypothetical protein [uncultured Tenacibaculum sp.]